MMFLPSVFREVVFIVVALSVTVTSHYLATSVFCHTHGSLQNTEFTISILFNKAKFLTYNSTENTFIGYSEYAMTWAKDLNSRSQWLRTEAEKVLADCRQYGREFMPYLNRTVSPEVVVRSLRPSILVCSAYDFYPKIIRVSWLRDGKPVTSDVVSTEELADGDWYYQIHSHLEYTPRPGEKISCVVEHASFQKPMVYDWDPSLPGPEQKMLVVGAAGLVLGVTAVTAGFLYYKRKCTEWTSVHLELS